MSRHKLLMRWIELDELLRMVGLRRRASVVRRTIAGAGFAFAAMAVGMGAGLLLGPSYGRRLRQGWEARIVRLRALRGEHAQPGHVGTDSSPHS